MKKQGCKSNEIKINGKCFDKKDKMDILTKVSEKLGFKAYPGQSLNSYEEIIHFIDKDGNLLDIILNGWPDEEIIQAIKGED